MKTTVTRKLQFCAGHRVMNHESKCRNLHGHNYTVYITAQQWPYVNAEGTDALGRVVDFSVLKEKLGSWLELHWDHGFIVFDQDAAIINALGFIERQKLYLLPFNPTAENMARFLLHHICPTLFQMSGVRATSIRIVETDNCEAEVSL